MINLGTRGDKFCVSLGPFNSASLPGSVWLWVAPVGCKLLQITEIHGAAAATATLGIRKFTVDGSAPGTAANGTTIVELLTSSTVLNLASAALNTTVVVPLSTVKGALIIPSGARIGALMTGSPASLTGCSIVMTFRHG